MVSNCPYSMCDHFKIMTLVRAAPVSANEVPANSWSAVLDVGYSGVKEQYVIQYIFLLVCTWGPSLDLISATVGKTFCHYHISPSDGWFVYPRELNPVGEPIMKYMSHHVGSVQLLSRVRLFANPWTAGCQASLSITNSQSSPKLMSIESVMPSSHLILCHPLLPPSIFSQHQGLFKWVSSSHHVDKKLEIVKSGSDALAVRIELHQRKI